MNIDEINAAHQAATQGKWGMSEPWAGFCAFTVDGKEVIYTATADCPNREADHKYLIAAANAWPAVYAEMLALREDRHYFVDMIRRLDQESLCDFFDDMGAEEHLQQWLSARDARMRREGAAAWLTGYIRGLLDMEPSAYKGAALAHLPQELERLKGGE